MAKRFSVNKADPSVFVSANDVTDGGRSSPPGVTVDSPRLSTGSPDTPRPVDAGNNETPTVAFADVVDDQEGGNNNVFVVDYH